MVRLRHDLFRWVDQDLASVTADLTHWAVPSVNDLGGKPESLHSGRSRVFLLYPLRCLPVVHLGRSRVFLLYLHHCLPVVSAAGFATQFLNLASVLKIYI